MELVEFIEEKRKMERDIGRSILSSINSLKEKTGYRPDRISVNIRTSEIPFNFGSPVECKEYEIIVSVNSTVNL